MGWAMASAANKASSHLTKVAGSTQDSRSWSASSRSRMTLRRLMGGVQVSNENWHCARRGHLLFVVGSDPNISMLQVI